ncbi:MAG: ROK family protein [Anaerolineae bacterium]|nr:ROK family protein [Anaerolineae bacterium]
MTGTIIGLDIGGTKSAVVEGGRDAEIYQRRGFTTPADRPFDVAAPFMEGEIDQVLAAAQAAGRSVEALSVSVGGPLDIQRGLLTTPEQLPNWHGAPLRDWLETRYGRPAYVEHDGNTGALAEYHFGAGQGARILVFLTFGTGLGAGIMIDGRVLYGVNDLAGEVGHIRIAPDGPSTHGKSGTWEGYASGVGLVYLARMRQPRRWAEPLATRTIVAAALDGDPDALALVREAGQWLGRGLAVLVDVLNPDRIVVGTLGVVLGDLVLEPARAAMRAEALAVSAAACAVVPAGLGARLQDVQALMGAIDRHPRGGLE